MDTLTSTIQRADGLPSGVGAVPLNIVDGVRVGSGCGISDAGTGTLEPDLAGADPGVALAFLRNSRQWASTRSAQKGRFTIAADRIILCGGAIQSAHLLMLSGSGTKPRWGRRRAGGGPITGWDGCIDHPEWVLPTTWTVAAGRPVLEVVLTTPDDIEIRPYTGGFVAMIGDGTAGHPDWPHIGVALMQPRARGRIRVVSPDPRWLR